ncbi:MAG: cupin domain-containing protein [Chloroflexota bacterium]|nr:cupin domain-containing protein [Chloroflexota bacterium]
MDEELAGLSATALSTKQLGGAYDLLAPDSSEIHLLVSTTRGSLVHGTLPPGRVSLAIAHLTVEEVWYVIEGRGQVWRKQRGREAVVDVKPGTALTIPIGAHFQFRATGPEPLRFVMCTMPPWPGEQEAVRVPDYWPVAEADAADPSPSERQSPGTATTAQLDEADGRTDARTPPQSDHREIELGQPSSDPPACEERG